MISFLFTTSRYLIENVNRPVNKHVLIKSILKNGMAKV